MKAAAAVAEILKREGVGFLIGYPVNPIIEAAAEADIRTIIVRQERTGLHMADAVSRIASGERIGVFAMQHGPGAENSFGGVAQAYGDSVPIVVLPAGYPRRLINIPPNFNSFLNYQHVTKWAEQVVMADAVPDAMRRAFTQVKNGRPRRCSSRSRGTCSARTYRSHSSTGRRRGSARRPIRATWRGSPRRSWRPSGRSSTRARGCTTRAPGNRSASWPSSSRRR